MKKILSVFLALCVLCGCSPQAVEEVVENVPETMVSETPAPPEKSIYEEDAEYLVKTIEDTHPCFVLDAVPEGYETAKEEYLEAVKGVGSEVEFYFASMRFTAVFNDGHTSLSMLGAGMTKVLEMNHVWQDGSQWLTNESDVITGEKIISMGGVSIDEIWSSYREILPMENDSAYNFYDEMILMDSLLNYVGVDTSADKLTVIVEKDGQQYEKNFGYYPFEEFIAAQNSITTISYEMIDDVFYIDMNRCVVDDNLNVVCAALEEAVANGQEKVIIDVRGNSGGDTAADVKILNAMGMTNPSYTHYIRVSGTDLYNIAEQSNTEAVQNPNVQLIVLSDEGVFSSATTMCIYVQDGNLGQVIGRPSSNSPNLYGNVRVFYFPNTKLRYQISMDYWLRPDVNANREIMEMDVWVPHGTDALDVALEMLKNQ